MENRKQFFLNLAGGLSLFVVAWFVFFSPPPPPTKQLALLQSPPIEAEIIFLSPLTRIFKPTSLSVGTPSNIATIANLSDYSVTPNIVLLKNEAESLQVVLNSDQPHRASLNYAVLLNGQPTNDLTLELHQVDFAPATYQLYSRPDDLSPRGLYSDPLTSYQAGATISAGEPAIWWISARAAANARAGVYSVVLNLTVDGRPIAKTFEVRVLNYGLPKQSAFKLVFNTKFNEGAAGYTPFDYHGAKTAGEKAAVVRNYLTYFNKNRLNHDIPYFDPACDSCRYNYTDALNLPVTGLDLNAGTINVDFSSFDNLMRDDSTAGNVGFLNMFASAWGFYQFKLPLISGDDLITQKEIEKYTQIQELYWQTTAGYLRARGLADKSFIYIDEPFAPNRQGEYIVKDNVFTDILKRASPETAVVALIDEGAVDSAGLLGEMKNIDYYAPIEYVPEYIWAAGGRVNPWRVLEPAIESLMDPTDKLGTYWTSNGHIHLDRPGIDSRIWGLKYWKNKIVFLYHWNVLQFAYDPAQGKVNPWESVSYKWGAGGTTLFYPPCKTGQCATFNPAIIPSIRSEAYRDALEDYDYLDILDRLIAEAVAKRLDVAAARQVLATASNLIVDLSNWTRDTQKFEAAKRAVALAIVSLNEAIRPPETVPESPITPIIPITPIAFPITPNPVPAGALPQTVSDLRIDSVESKSATLVWTAPYQDLDNSASGLVASYDLRYARDPIMEANWPLAAPAEGEPAPAEPGRTQTYILVNLGPGQTYHAAVKSSDAAGNISSLSNVVSFITTSDTAPPPPGGGGGGNTGGSDNGGGAAAVFGDTAPPSPPVILSNYGFDGHAVLNWRNPPDTDFVRVLILRSAAPLPVITSPGNPHYLSQAAAVYDGAGAAFVDADLINGKLYYYTFYAYDRSGNYARPVTVTVRAGGERQVLILQLMGRLLELLRQLLALMLARPA